MQAPFLRAFFITASLDVRSLGFVRDRKIGKHRWVVAKVVEPNHS